MIINTVGIHVKKSLKKCTKKICTVRKNIVTLHSQTEENNDITQSSERFKPGKNKP